MTRQHFKAIADIIAQYRSNDGYLSSGRHDIEDIAVKLAGEFRSFNRNFDATRFLKACGVVK